MLIFLYKLLKDIAYIRYQFISSSDWCADKIYEIQEDAVNEIVEIVTTKYKVDEIEAIKWVPDSILNAKKEWIEQKENFQNNLMINKIKNLSQEDYYPGISLRYK